MPGAVGAVGAGFSSAPPINDVSDAAKAFEAMLLKQLLSSMTQSTKGSGMFAGGFEADLYSDMFASAVAEEAAGGGSGLSEMIQKALGVEERSGIKELESMGKALRGFSAYRAGTTGDASPPSNGYLSSIAGEWLSGGATSRWSAAGELLPTDIGADLVTPGVGGMATFNVEDAGGYKGHPKCNLFAFEMVRRAGYTVPVRARSHGWSYPGADAVAKMAERGDTAGWATVRTGVQSQELDRAALEGAPLILASAAQGDAVGHMAVADRIHGIQRDAAGNITSLEYSGWDAAKNGSRYGRKIWRVAGVKGEGRGGLSSIQILQPSVNANSGGFVQVGSGRPGASLHDATRIPAGGAQGSARGTDILLENVSGVPRDALEATK